MRNIHLLVIDPQNDFCDPNGSLFVTAANEHMARLAKMVDRLRGKLDDIHVTLDSHRQVDISHGVWYRDASSGDPAPPFTMMKLEGRPIEVKVPGPGGQVKVQIAGNIINGYNAADNKLIGEFQTRQPGAQNRTMHYLHLLTVGKRYPHVIWPNHCLIGDEGHNIIPVLSGAIHDWEEKVYGGADFVTKGSNMWTEHFSGVKAEVPDPTDPTTQVNTGLIQTLERADVVLLAGEARSHCLANTVRDVRDNFSDPEYVKKMHLLTDATGDVPGFESFGDDFVRELTGQGMNLTTTTDFMRSA